MPDYDAVEAGILMEGMTSEQKLQFHREMSDAWRDPKKAARLRRWLGGIGAHHRYLGDSDRANKCLLFFWTGIPVLMAMFEGDIRKRTERINSDIAMQIAARIKGGVAPVIQQVPMPTPGSLPTQPSQTQQPGISAGSALPSPAVATGSGTKRWVLIGAGLVIVLAVLSAIFSRSGGPVSTEAKAAPSAASERQPPSESSAPSQLPVRFESLNALLESEERVRGRLAQVKAKVSSAEDGLIELTGDETVNWRFTCQPSPEQQESFKHLGGEQEVEVVGMVPKEGPTVLRNASAEQVGLYALKLTECRVIGSAPSKLP